jgi:tellurite resistance protein
VHVILAFLGTVVTILVLLRQLAEAGIDLAGLNPFLWQRRRRWMQRSQGDPLYQLDNPMDVTALMMVAIAKSDGDMTSEEKHKILELFRGEFNLTKRDASDMMVASVFLLRDGKALRSNVRGVLAPSLEKFSREQAESAINLAEQVARIDSRPSEIKDELVQSIKTCLEPKTADKTKWN